MIWYKYVFLWLTTSFHCLVLSVFLPAPGAMHGVELALGPAPGGTKTLVKWEDEPGPGPVALAGKAARVYGKEMKRVPGAQEMPKSLVLIHKYWGSCPGGSEVFLIFPGRPLLQKRNMHRVYVIQHIHLHLFNAAQTFVSSRDSSQSRVCKRLSCSPGPRRGRWKGRSFQEAFGSEAWLAVFDSGTSPVSLSQ